MIRKLILFLFLSGFIIASCNSKSKNALTQTSTIDALLAGVFDGNMTYNELLNYGDFGIGTFNQLDGEMLMLDGIVYQIKADGKIYKPDGNITTPFASVCYFSQDQLIEIKDVFSELELQGFLDKKNSKHNSIWAIKIQGHFTSIKTRSVPKQSKPYPPLSEIAKTQPEFEATNINGTLIGFRSPSFIGGINFPGYHFHFISDDGSFGGHVLSFEIENGIVELDVIDRFQLLIPDQSEFHQLDLSKDRAKELQQTED